MRTIKRYSLPLNKGKWEEVVRLARLYRDEKNVHLRHYSVDQNYAEDKSSVDQQMRCVAKKYKSQYGLQARQWKIAQKEAYQTVDKYWCALAVDVKTVDRQP